MRIFFEKRPTLRVLFIVLLTIAIGGCARGYFGSRSCDRGERIAFSVSDTNPPETGKAVAAIYVDKDGRAVAGLPAEELLGTYRDRMCPTPDPSVAACPTGYCARAVAGGNQCTRC